MSPVGLVKGKACKSHDSPFVVPTPGFLLVRWYDSVSLFPRTCNTALGSIVECSKVLDLDFSLFGDVGLNPATARGIFSRLHSLVNSFGATKAYNSCGSCAFCVCTKELTFLRKFAVLSMVPSHTCKNVHIHAYRRSQVVVPK